MLKNVFLTFYNLQAGPPNVAGSGVSYLPTLSLNEPECINNALINVLKN